MYHYCYITDSATPLLHQSPAWQATCQSLSCSKARAGAVAPLLDVDANKGGGIVTRMEVGLGAAEAVGCGIIDARCGLVGGEDANLDTHTAYGGADLR